ncbi:EscU/YscU/HrcU family type III secretion system export apparatus switch protein [Fictibacillus sp. Mic-4]|uniref:EscU/YscU/HrcU family type III secretion system export apparatus switch protein n=1 Tax=Fictibacillus sp. Mic-4 TaxID=3132826 RepID=UPI003CEE2C29
MRSQYFNAVNRKKMNGPSAAVIQYDESSGRAPKVTAQGRGKLAEEIIKLAQKHNIPIQKDESLIGNLLEIDLGESIPPQLYAVIAEILLMIEQLEKEY